MRGKSNHAASCPNELCDSSNIALNGYSKVKWAKRRRYRCSNCGETFGATTGTPYNRLQHPMRKFDRVASITVEGVSKSSIARLEGLSWNTVPRWLELAASLARRFNNAKTRGYVLRELQLDELSTFLQSRNRKTWVLADIEVWSRLWPATLVGSRSFRNTRQFVGDIADGCTWIGYPLITIDREDSMRLPFVACLGSGACSRRSSRRSSETELFGLERR